MICSKCGYMNNTDTNFCTNCGESLNQNYNQMNNMNNYENYNQQKPNKNKKLIIGIIIGVIAVTIIPFIIMFITSAVAVNKYLDTSRINAFRDITSEFITAASDDYIMNNEEGSKCYFLEDLNSIVRTPVTKAPTGNKLSTNSYVKVYMENSETKYEACIIDEKHNGFNNIQGSGYAYVDKNEFKQETASDCNCN